MLFVIPYAERSDARFCPPIPFILGLSVLSVLFCGTAVADSSFRDVRHGGVAAGPYHESVVGRIAGRIQLLVSVRAGLFPERDLYHFRVQRGVIPGVRVFLPEGMACAGGIIGDTHQLGISYKEFLLSLMWNCPFEQYFESWL